MRNVEVRVSGRAFADLLEAYHWYESQVSGLGRAFMKEIETVLDRIREFPRAHPVLYRGARRALVRRFPYAIYYLLENDALVIACCHTKQQWSAWMSRVQ